VPSAGSTAATAAGTTPSAGTPAPGGTIPAAAPSRVGGGASGATGNAPAPAATFERFIAARPASANDREQREYTANALRRLADDLRTLGASRAGIRAIVANADSLRMNRARQSDHPDYARAAFLAAVREMDLLRGRYRAPVDTGALRAAAWAVRPDQRFVAQRGIVQTFFERARDALQVLSRSAGARRNSNRRTR
jgi:hypothetical protein